MKLMQMLTGTEPAPTSGKNRKIAVIYVVGEIVDGKASAGLFTSETIGGDTMVKASATRTAIPIVSAIVLRIDSPGGSAGQRSGVAGGRDVQETGRRQHGRRRGQRRILHRHGRQEIIAEPGTITGSIGVVGGKIALKGLMDKIGVKTESSAAARIAAGDPR